jgi:hypothetical protein
MGFTHGALLIGKADARAMTHVGTATERMVYKFKRYDMLGGAPVHMSEWGILDDYLNVI